MWSDDPRWQRLLQRMTPAQLLECWHRYVLAGEAFVRELPDGTVAFVDHAQIASPLLQNTHVCVLGERGEKEEDKETGTGSKLLGPSSVQKKGRGLREQPPNR